MIGFDPAIERSAALLDINDPAQIRRMFPRVYPLGLGIISTSPLRMARAFSVFGNQGRAVTPIAIRSVEDRNGRVIFDVERDVRQRQRRMGDSIQVVSPQNAYIMTKVMEKTVEEGSLASGSGWGSKFTYRDENGTYRLPVAGKTGTPQNWSDAWVVGYSPYYTTAVWFGFDRPGNSLGVELTGATLAGPVWGDYMREIHRGLPRRNFVRPSSGLIDVTVCVKSGLLKTASCTDGDVTFPFLEGTQPNQYCEYHGRVSPHQSRISITTTMQFGGIDEAAFLDSLTMPQLPPDFLPEFFNEPQQRNNQPAARTPAPNTRNPATNSRNPTPNTRNTTPNTRNTTPARPAPAPLSNPFLDDAPPVIEIPMPEMPFFETPMNEIPESNTNNMPDTRSEPAVFPDTVIQFVPREEDDEIDEGEYDDDLPGWNPLG